MVKQYSLKHILGQWDPAWSNKRMRMVLYFGLKKEALLRSIFKELEPKDYRLRSISFHFKKTICLMRLTKMGHFTQASMEAEVLHILEISDRLGVRALECVDVEDPSYDDLSVN